MKNDGFLTDKELKELKELYSKTLHGFWYETCSFPKLDYSINCVDESVFFDRSICVGNSKNNILDDKNMKFISYSYNCIPKMINEIETLRKIINNNG